VKLTQLFQHHKSESPITEEEILTEGLRFGMKEKHLVDKESRDFRIGIEYEFKVNEGAIDGEYNDEFYDAVYDRANELMQEDMEGKKESFLEDWASNDMNEFNVGSATGSLHTIKEQGRNIDEEMSELDDIVNNVDTAFIGWDGDDEDQKEFNGFTDKDDLELYERFIELLSNITDQLKLIASEAQSIEVDDQLDRFIYYISDDAREIENNWEEFKSASYALSDYINDVSLSTDIDDIEDDKDVFENYSITDSIQTVYNMVSNNIMAMDGDDGDWDKKIEEGFKESAEDLWESEKEHYLGYDPDNIHETEFYETAREEIEREGDFKSMSIERVEEQLSEHGIDMDKISSVEPEGDMAEVITKPINLMDTLKLMEEMFDFISDEGDTSHGGAGMHINVSIKGLKFNKDNMNPAKLMVLLDPKFLHNEVNFPSRNHVANILNQFDSERILELAFNPNMSMLIDEFEAGIKNNISSKFYTLNFRDRDNDTDTQRIEFRFFGGRDYEARFDEIKEQLYRTLYITMVAYSEEFGQKEYYRKVTQILNNKADEYFDMNFFDLVKIVKDAKTHDRDAITHMIKLNKKRQWVIVKEKDTGGVYAYDPIERDLYTLINNELELIEPNIYDVIERFDLIVPRLDKTGDQIAQILKKYK